MGKLITIDGLDGCGKQTQSELLLSGLTERGIKVKLVSFPNYDSEACALVKMYLSGQFSEDPNAVNAFAASSFFAVDRVASYILDWKKDYDEDTVIIANRYTTANAIHQLSKIDDDALRAEFLDWLYDFEFTKLSLPRPDLTLYLKLPVEISLSLIEKRSAETGREIDIHENKAHLSSAASAAEFSARYLGWQTVECAENGKIRTIESISAEIMGVVEKLLVK